MIFSQIKLRLLFLILIIVFTTVYLSARFQMIDISLLLAIEYFAILFCLLSWLLGIFFMYKNVNKLWLIYEILGIGLMIFFIMSIFILKIEDLYFWNENKELYKSFFSFSFSVYGWDFILFFPFVILLVCEAFVLRTKIFKNR